MRISDWSSDVCSSDLRRLLPRRTKRLEGCIDGRPIERKAVIDNQIGANAFAKAVIGITDGGSLTNAGNPEQQVLDLERGNIPAAANDDILFAIGNGEQNRCIEEIGSASCRERVCKYV